MTGAPDHLTAAQAELWDELADPLAFDVESDGARALLEVAVVQLAIARGADAEIRREGLTVHINAGKTLVQNPLVKVQREAHALAARALSQLRRQYPPEVQRAMARREDDLLVKRRAEFGVSPRVATKAAGGVA